MARGQKPITSSTFLILLALVDHDRHGLGIADDIETRTDGGARLGPGTLYNAIRKLLDEGLIAESPKRPSGDSDDPRRRYYQITAAGRRTVKAEVGRLDLILAMARDKSLLG